MCILVDSASKKVNVGGIVYERRPFYFYMFDINVCFDVVSTQTVQRKASYVNAAGIVCRGDGLYWNIYYVLY